MERETRMIENKRGETLARCPICGKRATVIHLVADGLDFGWEAGFAAFCNGDGIHGITGREDPTPYDRIPNVHGTSRKNAIVAWNKWVDRWKEEHGGTC